MTWPYVGIDRPCHFSASPGWPTYSFGIVTAALFLLSWAGQFMFQLMEVRDQASQHGERFSWSEFCPQFFSSTFEN